MRLLRIIYGRMQMRTRSIWLLMYLNGGLYRIRRIHREDWEEEEE